MFDRNINSMTGEIVRVGRYCARLALSKKDLLAAQQLRYKCFKLSNDKGLDADSFDSMCRHVLIENLENGKLTCCYRIMSFANGKDITRSYSSQFYDLAPIKNYPKPIVDEKLSRAAAKEKIYSLKKQIKKRHIQEEDSCGGKVVKRMNSY